MADTVQPINVQLIDSLVQVILSLSTAEQALLEQKIRQHRHPDPAQLEGFFQELDALEPDPDQPTLQEISQVVRAVRRDLWVE